MSRLGQAFFGLSSSYIRKVYEQFHLMKYYGGWSFIEAYNLPIELRNYYVDLLTKQLEKEQEAVEKANQKARSKSK